VANIRGRERRRGGDDDDDEHSTVGDWMPEWHGTVNTSSPVVEAKLELKIHGLATMILFAFSKTTEKYVRC
jgi:hypothetical protein